MRLPFLLMEAGRYAFHNLEPFHGRSATNPVPLRRAAGFFGIVLLLASVSVTGLPDGCDLDGFSASTDVDTENPSKQTTGGNGSLLHE